MKTHNKLKIVDKKIESNISAMSTHARPTSNSILGSEVSLSFQDELAATIHGAFEVAVEIAVLEVTKLVGQALGDVRDQMHETLRENKSLKQRLQAAEVELSVRGSRNVGDERQAQGPVTDDNVCPTAQLQQSQKSPSPLLQVKLNPGKAKTPKDETPNATCQVGTSTNVAVNESYGLLAAPSEASTRPNGSFSEIREDGRVCSQKLDDNLEKPARSQEFVKAIKRSSPTLYPESPANLNLDATPEMGGASALCSGSGSPKVEQVMVKEEKAETDHGCGSGLGPSASIAEEDHFSADCLSLAQSKLLEDWRPEPLHLQSCSTEPVVPCTSLSLSDPPIFSQDAPDQNTLAPATSIFPAPNFQNSFQPAETVGLSGSQLPYAGQMGGAISSAPIAPPRLQVCKVCGEAFHQLGDLRRHHSQRHNPKPRNPRRQIFPPGRSPYHCTQCGRDFNRMENLKTHLRIHTGERPYTCSVCGVRFRHSGALTRHFRIHTGEKPYACSQCGKTFRNCGGLRFHQRSHSREGKGQGN
ncbi:hypothetical protein GJAV_G00197180 [Gymnothorax javanicus]|nr:hypothetical protein GJAV_G00197180 [Gymnothorax javanicus]